MTEECLERSITTKDDGNVSRKDAAEIERLKNANATLFGKKIAGQENVKATARI